jgi:hypothetical protein
MTATMVVRQGEVAESGRFWPQDLILGLLPFLVAFQLLFAVTYLPQGLRGFSDFRQLYSGAYIVRTGHAVEIYNYDAQQLVEETLVPVGEHYVLPINHLAYEELLLAPLSFLSYRNAYLVFLTFNAILLGICASLLTSTMREFSVSWKWIPPVLILSFCPIARTLLQGQDSIILLTLLAAAWWSLHRKKELLAGLLVGLGLFKFQIVLPIALLFLLWRRWRFSLGFAASSGAAGLVSLWLIGLAGARQYIDMLISMSLRLTSPADVLRYCTNPRAMLNLRGLVTAILDGRVPHGFVQLLVAVCSIAILVIAARQRPSFPLAIATASLVSYHFLSHDASILIIVLGAALCSGSVWMGAASVVLLLAPLTSIVPAYGYLAAIPLLGIFLLMLEPARKSQTVITPSEQGAFSVP